MSALKRRLHGIAAMALLAASALAGCSSQVPDEVNAQWTLIDPAGVNESSTSLQLGVMAIACTSGTTGEIAATDVELSNDQIVIGIAVEPAEGDTHTCPGNETVPYTLELDEPVGDRTLIDASCLEGIGQKTTACQDGGIRWSPPAEQS
ncbi:MAG: hypothetical protein ACTICQ_06830 [Glutamicibacter arilaitensis]|uniref:hypothetical protein n=1 Tax=Glutamicibacter arilaitensis TaxID=256701 RepID=UPI003FB69472